MVSSIFAKGLVFVAACAMIAAVLLTLRHPAADYLFEQGMEAKKAWRLDRAIRNFRWALRLKSGFVEAGVEKAICHQLGGDYLAARRELDLLMAGEIIARPLRARLLNAVGVNHFHANEPDAALEAHRRSLELAKEPGDRRLEAQALVDLSRVLYHTKGRDQEALDALHQALRIGRELGDELIEADALRNIGVVYWWHRGEYERPLLEYYEPALAIYRRQNDLRSAAITLSNIGHLRLNKGDFLTFLKYQNESLEIQQRIGDLAGLSDSYCYLGNMYNVLQNYRKAHEYYARSLELSQRIGYRLTQNDVEGLLARIYTEVGEYDKAIEMYHRLLDREREALFLAKYRVAALAYCYLLKGDPERAQQHVERALELGASDSRYRIGILNILGRAYTQMGDRQKAFARLDEARGLNRAQGEKWWYGEVENRFALAELAERQGERAEALRYLLEAAEIESHILGASDSHFLQGQDRRLYDRLFTLLLNPRNGAPPINPAAGSPPDEETAFRILEQLRYRSFRNLLVQLGDKPTQPLPREGEKEAVLRIERASARLKTHDGPEAREQLRRAYGEYEDMVLRSELARPRYQLVRRARPAELAAVQRSLDAETALIEYLFAGDQVYALVITRSMLRSAALPVTLPNLSAKAHLLRSLIFNGAEEPGLADWQPVACDLRRALIEPLEQAGVLAGVRRLGVIPFGFLHDLPFAALARMEGDGVKFLVEDYTLFHPSSATLMTLENVPAPPAPQEREVFSFGRNEADEPGLPPLRFAVEEALAVADLIGGQARVGAQASESELKRLAPRCQVLHLAAHAVSEAQMPLLSRIKLQSAGEEDGNLSIRETLDLGLRAELVTLAACQTGQGFSATGDERGDLDRIGLIEAFLHAGAESVLASLLPVSDRPTTEFMKAFYRNLQSMEKAEALAATQRAMLRGEIVYTENNGPHLLTHPRYWSPFILVGDFR